MAAKGDDYIIVGAGSVGCVLAGRLTVDGTKCVLLVEGRRARTTLRTTGRAGWRCRLWRTGGRA